MPRYQNQEDADILPPSIEHPLSSQIVPEESYDFDFLDAYASSLGETFRAVHFKLSRYHDKNKGRIVLEIRARPGLKPLMAINMSVAESRKIYKGFKRLSRKREYRRNDAKKEAP